jgi:hypothetical protein
LAFVKPLFTAYMSREVCLGADTREREREREREKEKERERVHPLPVAPMPKIVRLRAHLTAAAAVVHIAGIVK